MTNEPGTAAEMDFDLLLDEFVRCGDVDPRSPESAALLSVASWIDRHVPQPDPRPEFESSLRRSLAAVEDDRKDSTVPGAPRTRPLPFIPARARSRFRQLGEFAAGLVLLLTIAWLLAQWLFPSSEPVPAGSAQSGGIAAAGTAPVDPSPTVTQVVEVVVQSSGSSRSVSSDFALGERVATTYEMELRSGPGLRNDVRAIIEAGHPLVVNGDSIMTPEGSVWVPVLDESTGDQGWVNRAWLQSDPAFAPTATPSGPAPTALPFESAELGIVKIDDGLSLPGMVTYLSESTDLMPAPDADTDSTSPLNAGDPVVIVDNASVVQSDGTLLTMVLTIPNGASGWVDSAALNPPSRSVFGYPEGTMIETGPVMLYPNATRDLGDPIQLLSGGRFTVRLAGSLFVDGAYWIAVTRSSDGLEGWLPVELASSKVPEVVANHSLLDAGTLLTTTRIVRLRTTDAFTLVVRPGDQLRIAGPVSDDATLVSVQLVLSGVIGEIEIDALRSYLPDETFPLDSYVTVSVPSAVVHFAPARDGWEQVATANPEDRLTIAGGPIQLSGQTFLPVIFGQGLRGLIERSVLRANALSAASQEASPIATPEVFFDPLPTVEIVLDANPVPGTIATLIEDTSLLASTDQSSEIVQTLLKNTTVVLTGSEIASGGQFFLPVEVISGGRTGWIRSTSLRFAERSNIGYAAGTQLITSVDTILFEHASALSSQLRALPLGSTLTVTAPGSFLENDQFWIAVESADGTTGWIAYDSSITHASDVLFPIDSTVVVMNRAELRADPPTDGIDPVTLASLLPGSRLIVTGAPVTSFGNNWLPVRVELGGAIGWVAMTTVVDVPTAEARWSAGKGYAAPSLVTGTLLQPDALATIHEHPSPSSAVRNSAGPADSLIYREFALDTSGQLWIGVGEAGWVTAQSVSRSLLLYSIVPASGTTLITAFDTTLAKSPFDPDGPDTNPLPGGTTLTYNGEVRWDDPERVWLRVRTESGENGWIPAVALREWPFVDISPPGGACTIEIGQGEGFGFMQATSIPPGVVIKALDHAPVFSTIGDRTVETGRVVAGQELIVVQAPFNVQIVQAEDATPLEGVEYVGVKDRDGTLTGCIATANIETNDPSSVEIGLGTRFIVGMDASLYRLPRPLGDDFVANLLPGMFVSATGNVVWQGSVIWVEVKAAGGFVSGWIMLRKTVSIPNA